MPMALLSQRHLRGLCILMSIKDRNWDRVVWDCELRFRKKAPRIAEGGAPSE